MKAGEGPAEARVLMTGKEVKEVLTAKIKEFEKRPLFINLPVDLDNEVNLLARLYRVSRETVILACVRRFFDSLD